MGCGIVEGAIVAGMGRGTVEALCLNFQLGRYGLWLNRGCSRGKGGLWQSRSRGSGRVGDGMADGAAVTRVGCEWAVTVLQRHSSAREVN